jgi:hypothetical protein
MLKKIFGCSLITKLRSILLMERDFNATNKRIYGIGMMQNVRKYRLLPEEIYSECNRLANDGTLAKVLFYNIVRQTRCPAGLALVDNDNCYNRIAHPIASMTFQAFGVPTPAIKAMLSTIQNMRFFLRTGYGDSKDSSGGNRENPIKTQGMCQGNTASPAAWTVTSIPMINPHRHKGHGAHFIAPISGRKGQLVGEIFVDDTNLIHLNMQLIETTEAAHRKFQDSVTSWGKLLIATGGALKPIKCSHYIISFKWNSHGQWSYEANEATGVSQSWFRSATVHLRKYNTFPLTKRSKRLDL